jgi:hypothetical protein
VYRGLFPQVKQLERNVDGSTPSSADIKNAWSYIPTSPYDFMAWFLIKHRDKIIYILIYEVTELSV